MRTNDAQGNPILVLTGQVALGNMFVSTETGNNAMFLKGKIYLQNRTDSIWYPLILETQNDTLVIFADPSNGITRGF